MKQHNSLKIPTVLTKNALIWGIQTMKSILKSKRKTVQETISKARLCRDCRRPINSLYGLKLINTIMGLRNNQCFQVQKI